MSVSQCFILIFELWNWRDKKQVNLLLLHLLNQSNHLLVKQMQDFQKFWDLFIYRTHTYLDTRTRTVFVHNTCATDTENVRKVFKVILKYIFLYIYAKVSRYLGQNIKIFLDKSIKTSRPKFLDASAKVSRYQSIKVSRYIVQSLDILIKVSRYLVQVSRYIDQSIKISCPKFLDILNKVSRYLVQNV